MAMTTIRVVVHLDAVEDIPPSFFSINVDAPTNPFPLE